MLAICTLCSSEKRTDKGLLPAQWRYLSDRIEEVRDIARNEHVPFYILSGRYGFISITQPIEYYDHVLTEAELPEFIEKVAKEIQEAGVTHLRFYAKPRTSPNWENYYRAIEEASLRSDIKLEIVELENK